MDRLFLDANVLFSAAYGSPRIERLWSLQRDGHCVLLCSDYVCDEARRNLQRPELRQRLTEKLDQAFLVPEAPGELCPIDVAAKDRAVVSAALAAQATHLITGDVRHFRAHYGRTVGGMAILRPTDYLWKRDLTTEPA